MFLIRKQASEIRFEGTMSSSHSPMSVLPTTLRMRSVALLIKKHLPPFKPQSKILREESLGSTGQRKC